MRWIKFCWKLVEYNKIRLYTIYMIDHPFSWNDANSKMRLCNIYFWLTFGLVNAIYDAY